MNCFNCGKSLPDHAAFCDGCGAAVETPAVKYSAPEGFLIAASSGLYYRIEYDHVSGEAIGATWFNPMTGEYTQSFYEKQEPQFEPNDEAPLVSTDPSAASVPVPDGFLLDPQSGLYYLMTQNPTPQSGTPEAWITWYDPETGRYRMESSSAAGQGPTPALSKQISESPLLDRKVPLPEPNSAVMSGPVREPISIPVQTPAPPVPVPNAGPQIPDSFLPDPNSGLYYRYTQSAKPETGASEQWITWFNPATGKYKQECLTPPAKTASQVSGGRRKGGMIACATMAVLILGAVGGHFLGLYSLPLLPDAQTSDGSTSNGGVSSKPNSAPQTSSSSKPADTPQAVNGGLSGTYRWRGGRNDESLAFSVVFSGSTATFSHPNGEELKATYTLDWPDEDKKGEIIFIPEVDSFDGNEIIFERNEITLSGLASFYLVTDIEKFDFGDGDAGYVIGAILFAKQ